MIQISNDLVRSAILAAAALVIASATTFAQSQLSAEARLKEQNITLPPPPRPVGNYVEYTRVGNLLFLAGHGRRYREVAGSM